MTATVTIDRATILHLWTTAWDAGLGFAPWRDALNGISPAHAVWSPAPGRHSIWAHVSHMCFWREYLAMAARGMDVPSDDEVRRRNFEAPASLLQTGHVEWIALCRRFEDSHRSMAAVYADQACHHDWMWGLIAHDSYHVGQVMLLRALQGLAPLM